MGKHLVNPSIRIGGIEIASLTRSVSVELSADEIDVTPLGMSNYREYMQGNLSMTCKLEMLMDDGADVVPSLPSIYGLGVYGLGSYGLGSVGGGVGVWDLLFGSAPLTVEVTPRFGPTSPTNPTYATTCLPFVLTPLSGSVGEAAAARCELRSIDEVVRNEA